jgi:hypothetical protein
MSIILKREDLPFVRCARKGRVVTTHSRTGKRTNLFVEIRFAAESRLQLENVTNVPFPIPRPTRGWPTHQHRRAASRRSHAARSQWRQGRNASGGLSGYRFRAGNRFHEPPASFRRPAVLFPMPGDRPALLRPMEAAWREPLLQQAGMGQASRICHSIRRTSLALPSGRRRLGEPDWDGFPPRPKHMRWRTYRGWEARYARLESELNEAWLKTVRAHWPHLKAFK